jgi:hypothetical protein
MPIGSVRAVLTGGGVPSEILDDFNRANGALIGSTTSNGKGVWSLASGTGASWVVASNRATYTVSASDNPIAVVNSRTAKVEVSLSISSGGGDAICARVVDTNNWLRLRMNSYSSTSTTYTTEYQWEIYYTVNGSGNLNAGETTGQHTHSTPFSPYASGWGTFSTPPSFSGTANHTHGTYEPNGTFTSNYAQRNHAHNYSGVYPQKTGATRQVASGTTTTNYYQVVLDKNVAGTITALSTSSYSSTPISSLKLRVNGTSLLGYINGSGSAIVSATESSHLTATLHGIGRASSPRNGSAMDTFSVIPL